MKRKKTNFYVWFWLLFATINCFCVLIGYQIASRNNEVKFDLVNFWERDMHYVIFQSSAGGTCVVNYTLDSLKKKQLEPGFIILDK